MRRTMLVAVVALALALPGLALASTYTVSATAQANLTVSPLTGAACAPVGPGTLYPNTEVEPWLVVNPANARNVVGTWQQDRYSGGAARASSAGVSMDGGKTFTQVTIPEIGRASCRERV